MLVKELAELDQDRPEFVLPLTRQRSLSKLQGGRGQVGCTGDQRAHQGFGFVD
ncbi:hypothetical protein [Amycolatopsis acidicola]|uniref:hypothetical protein n=1 Tax=Amycolatopsis acidicola TaxID=2596893 RepID=UPI00140C994B|nr:hypothetical protein [Amycolatopsis acidicola]